MLKAPSLQDLLSSSKSLELYMLPGVLGRAARKLIVVSGVVAVACVALLAPAASALAPANNDFSAAETLNGSLPITTTGSNVEATKEAGEPDHAGFSAGHSVWYSWQATSTAVVTVDTCGSNFDTVVGVYTGATVGGLSAVASDAFGAGPSCPFSRKGEVAFKAIEGTTYRIAVDGYEEEFEEEEFETDPEGEVKLTISLTSPPANDDFVNAEQLNALFPFVEAGNWGATKEAGEPNHAGDKGGASTWYSWTAPQSGTVLGFGCGTFESLFAVYTGASVNALTPVASAKTARGGCEEFAFTASAGAGLDVPLQARRPAIQGVQIPKDLQAAEARTAYLQGGCRRCCGQCRSLSRRRSLPHPEAGPAQALSGCGDPGRASCLASRRRARSRK
jgi:hypothetical protein